MTKIDAKELYMQIKNKGLVYKEELHCPMILDVMNEAGTMTAFCKRAKIGRSTFYRWNRKHKVFKECYEMGMVLSRSNWEEEGETGKSDEFFNFDLWRITGAMRYGVGKNRVRIGIDPKSNPYKQYQELITLANEEEFNASEIKQLMESINVGIRAFESFKLQEEVEKIKDDVTRMERNNAHNFTTIEETKKTD